MPRTRYTTIPAALALAAAAALTSAPDPATARAAGPGHYRVVNIAGAEYLKLRARPHRHARVIADVPFNARRVRNLADRRGPWVRVAHRGVRGWAHRRHLAEAGYRDEPTRYRVVNIDHDAYLNVRRRPTTHSQVIAQLDSSTRDLLARGRCEGNWCPIDCEGAIAWVYSRYIAVQDDRAPTRSADEGYGAGDTDLGALEDTGARRDYRTLRRNDRGFERRRFLRRLQSRVRRRLD